MPNCRENDTEIENIAARLQSAGLDLLAVLDNRVLREAELSDSWQALLLVGNSGPQMWQCMPADYRDRRDPVDEYAFDTVTQVLSVHLQTTDWQILFPAVAENTPPECPPLQQLGALAGWHHPSPLGTGINDRSGLWFAYRAVVGISSPMPAAGMAETKSPCLSCSAQPCVSACPAEAISYQRMPDMHACATFRLQPQSPCVDRCEARLACPVATAKQYSKAQLAHHYVRSLPSLRNWLASIK
jgi:ferredoxin